MYQFVSIPQANARLNQAEKDRAEVLHLQNTFRLSWVPDEVSGSKCCIDRSVVSYTEFNCVDLKQLTYFFQLVIYCSNNKCRAPFTQVCFSFETKTIRTILASVAIG